MARLGLVMATELEAGPLIAALDLRLLQNRPYRIYGNTALTLVISGIGKAHAAAGTAHLIERHAPELIANLGVAGALSDSFSLGELCQAASVTEPDRLDVFTNQSPEFTPATLSGPRQVRLATMDRPARTAAERAELAELAELIDMEGAAVIQTAATYGLSCHLIKLVSDTPEQPDLKANLTKNPSLPGHLPRILTLLEQIQLA
ncbi:MAG: nucleosidase [Deltaproteobacteria bacterium ADurb.Bin510]|nr:MAG: nucleosidase [Deltaproteobacteria bacterium ADurb.Bin510]